MGSSERIVARYLIAKAVSLIPEFKKALDAFKNQRDMGPMKALIEKVLEIVLPGGKPPDWFWALGTAKRNAIQALRKDGMILLNRIPERLQILETARNPNATEEQHESWKKHYFDATIDELEAWGKKLRTLEIASKAEDEGRAIDRGGFIIIPMPGVKKAEADAALEALDAATEKIRPKFPQVLYGKVFFSTHLSAKTAAHYVYADDTVHLSVRARKRFNDIYTLIHEFGHRYDHKFLKDDVRRVFWRLSTNKEYEKVVYDEKLRDAVAAEAVEIAKARKEKKPFLGMSPELERWVSYPMNARFVKDVMSDFLHGHMDEAQLRKHLKGTHDVTIDTDKLLHGPLAVTPYGATKPTENWAEAFAHYVLGMSMPQEFQDIFAKLP